jgi:hypothetical protein
VRGGADESSYKQQRSGARFQRGANRRTSAAMLTLLPIAASQLGLLKHVPDPTGSVFDSDRITSSKQATRWGHRTAWSGLPATP